MPTSADEIWAGVVRHKMGLLAGQCFDDLPEPQRTWAHYKLSAAERGRGVISSLAAHGWREGVRFLDAGCAYGGYLVAAAEAGARDVVGIDVDKDYLEMAGALLAAHRVPGLLELGSLEDIELQRKLCREEHFDVVTCTDVLEHVEDAAIALEMLARYLAPSGCAYVTIPNFRNPAWVRSDPHFQIGGITLLPPPSARATAYAVHPWLPRYSVGEYHPLAWYRSKLADLGLQTWLLNPPTDGLAQTAEALRGDALDIMQSRGELLNIQLPPQLRVELSSAIEAWANGLLDDVSTSKPDPAILDEYAIQTWELLAVRA